MALGNPTRQERARRRAPLTPDVRPLPHWAAQLASAEIRAASDAHEQALTQLLRLKHEASSAAVDVDQAADADRAAAEAAVRSAKPVPAATLPAAVEAREGADRATAAAEDLARTTQAEFLAAVAGGQAEFADSARAKHEALFAEAEPLLERVERILITLADVQRLREELEHPVQPWTRAAMFNVRGARPGRDPLAGTTRELLTRLRQALDAERPAGNRFAGQS